MIFLRGAHAPNRFFHPRATEKCFRSRVEKKYLKIKTYIAITRNDDEKLFPASHRRKTKRFCDSKLIYGNVLAAETYMRSKTTCTDVLLPRATTLLVPSATPLTITATEAVVQFAAAAANTLLTYFLLRRRRRRRRILFRFFSPFSLHIQHAALVSVVAAVVVYSRGAHLYATHT